MGIEIEFIPVGENTKNGDAIVVRYGKEGNYKIMVVDGGTKDSGRKIVEHIKKYYGTNYVDFVVNTHPDSDHASGLITVVEELEIGELWMHLPWEHSSKIRDLFKDGRITDNSLAEKIKTSLNTAYQLYERACEKEIPICEPFEGALIGEFKVLSPLEDWYVNYLLPDFPNLPERREQNVVSKALSEVYSKLLEWIEETWDKETLSENYESTGARNESSVVLYANVDDYKVLLTGDAGKQALHNSADYAESIGVDLKECSFVQMPHHGSRRNVSPSVLDRIIGERVPEGDQPTTTTYVSVSKQTEDHPKKIVVNAFIRRGAKVFETRGSTIRHHKNMPARTNWNSLTPLTFNPDVEK
ncbi:ComEC/Rec2 family competence protein [Cytobacillus firmus]|uniref:ComEC/Rec2 family competence protein n=1 Tax=Cytobacillus firmus TaxID=1399 RepID=UPI0024C1E4BC|nr:MBL fold metallo-hydrolase [Cytobacillus firmus]WHY63272.1 MBL fold metallo-hydrolase [Cytobacillus firmus]